MKINFFQIFFQIVNFTILLLLLRKYLYRPILKILEGRAKKIREGLEAAEKSIEGREKLEKQKREIVVEAEKNASKILEGARVRAKKLEKQLAEKSERETEKRLKKAETLAQAKLKQMEQELSRKFAQTVLATTESVLKDSIEIKDHRTIIKNQIQRIKKVKFA